MRSNIFTAIVTLIFISVLALSCKRRDSIPYATGEWNVDSLGYHRIEIAVSNDADVVLVDIPWRRRDRNPDKKAVLLTDKSSENIINNIHPVSVSNENGIYCFQPAYGPGTYFIYYLPGKMEGRSNYPKVYYPESTQTADNTWLDLHNLRNGEHSNLPRAEVISIQSSDWFNSFYPMEVIASTSEVSEMEAEYQDKSFLLFPEDRLNSIRMYDYLPLKWITEGPFKPVLGSAKRDEFYCFQVGLYNMLRKINNVEIEFTDLCDKSGKVVIPASEISSFNTKGSDWDGIKFSKTVSVDHKKVQPFWFGFLVPESAKKGKIRGEMSFRVDGFDNETLPITIRISDELAIDHGDDNPSDMTRMRWFNSTLAFDDEILQPFIPVEQNDNSLNILGRQIDIATGGLPQSYLTYFNPSNTGISEKAENVFTAPVSFNVYRKNGSRIYLDESEPVFKKIGEGRYDWSSESVSSDISINTTGSIEFDGFSSISLKLKANKDISLSEANLKLSLRKKFAEYFMGLGLRGGKRPYSIRWKWDQMKHQEGAWIGGINGGLQFALRNEKYDRPLNTNFYREKPLIMPDSWYNDGKGGINISTSEYSAIVNCYSGSREMKAGEELVFKINFLFTPFKTLNTEQQWSTRFYHSFIGLDSIQRYGANTVNVHHANEVNPWINYPFLTQTEMRSYIDSAHAKGMKVKIYNTIRELSNRAPEVFAIRSFGHEIFSTGPGNGFNWLQEHLGDDYIAAWFVPPLKDAAIINSGMSRWHNYYIEGMDWLTRQTEIDGLYLDDIAFDRTTMKRLRKVLDRNRDGAIIDLHSANQYNIRDGFTNSANLYMEHFPYVNRLWFGEYFDPKLPPDFWLVEMSGIPFGLMSEMLQDGGNQYRGLVYGMTSRAPWSGDPRNIWALYDEFGMEGCKFIGYWSSECPVKTGYVNAPATVFKKDEKVMVSIASWYDEPKELWLNIDWDELGIERSKANLRAPYIKDFQEEASYKAWDRIPLNPQMGVVLIISEE